MQKSWKLVGSDGKSCTSAVPGTLGGHRRSRIYGRLDCPSALRAITRGGYVTYRVFFLNAQTARAAGYRPCAVCLPDDYARWRAEPQDVVMTRLSSGMIGSRTRHLQISMRKEIPAGVWIDNNC